jgi:hypothetical protein
LAQRQSISVIVIINQNNNYKNSKPWEGGEFDFQSCYIVRLKCLVLNSTTKKSQGCWAPVAHACNLSYAGGRDSGGLWLEASLGKWFSRSYLEKTLHKKGLVE